MGDPPPCLDENDDRLITNSIDTFATDRHTAMAVNDAKYLAEDAVPHEGLVNKWPFNAEKKTYPYWDGTLDKAVDAKYVGTKDYDGLETYEYSVEVPETEAEVVEGTQGTYTAQQSVWIDPRTGSIIDQSGGEIRKLEDGSTILDIEVAYTDDDRRRQRLEGQGQHPDARHPHQVRSAGGRHPGPRHADRWSPGPAPSACERRR